MPQDRWLVIAPHVDDAELSLGALLSSRAGCDDAVVIVCAGSYVRSDGVSVSWDERRAEAIAGLAEVGVGAVRFLDAFAENMGHSALLGAVADKIDGAIAEFEPSEVLVCLPSFNQDHTAAHAAAVVAFRPGRHLGVRRLHAFEYPGNAWGPQVPETGLVYHPITGRDVTAQVRALRCHRSQFSGRPWLEPEAAVVLARQRGTEIGTEFAVKTYLLREIAR